MQRWFPVVMFVTGCGSVEGKKIDAGMRDAVDIDEMVMTDASTDAATCAATPSMQKVRYRAENNANDHTGTYNGTAMGANFSYTPGKYGQAFLFDGTDDVVTVNDADTLWPTGSFALEAWIKTTSTPKAANIILCKYACGSSCPASNNLAYFCLFLDQAGKPAFEFRPDAPASSGPDITKVTTTLVNVTDGNWHHLVGVRDTAAGTASLYVDGTLAASATPAAEQLGMMSNLDSEVDLVTIGATIVGGQSSYESHFTGAIDDVAIYHSALSASQVSAIAAAPQGKCL